MKQIMKNLSVIKLQTQLINFPGIKVDQKVLDQPRKVPEFHYCLSQPKKRKDPKIWAIASKTFEMLGINHQDIESNQQAAQFLSGTTLRAGSMPFANNYCGIQFGNWAGQLGDGRAHTLGEIVRKGKSYELQLKGSGMSPFSRFADGNSVVSSAVREFLASQLMYSLGVPTTRAGSLVVADENVARDPKYNGNIVYEKAAIVLRVCESFLRFGSLQIVNKGSPMHREEALQNRKLLLPLCDYLIATYYKDTIDIECDPYEEMFRRIVIGTAQLVAHWQSVGFVHGVLNTDNMSMVNVTIDYGPYGFIDYFSKDYVPNSSDTKERYSYRRQPFICKWNLQRLAESMDYLVPAQVLKQHINKLYQQAYESKYYSLMYQKLGIKESDRSRELVDRLFQVMHDCQSHFVNVFRLLATESLQKDSLIDQLVAQSCPDKFYIQRLNAYTELIGVATGEVLKADSGFNVHLVQDQAERCEKAARHTKETSQQRAEREATLWREWLKLYANEKPIGDRKTIHYVLLSDITVRIVDQLNKTDLEGKRQLLQKIMEVMYNPFTENQWFQQTFWKHRPQPIQLSCSS